MRPRDRPVVCGCCPGSVGGFHVCATGRISCASHHVYGTPTQFQKGATHPGKKPSPLRRCEKTQRGKQMAQEAALQKNSESVGVSADRVRRSRGKNGHQYVVADDRALLGGAAEGGKGNGSDVLVHKGCSIIRKNSRSVNLVSPAWFRRKEH